MRIAIVVNSFPKVSETFIFNKVIRLMKAGWDVTVVVHDTSNDIPFFQDQMMNTNIRVQKSGWNFRGIMSFLRAGIYVLQNLRITLSTFSRVQKREGGFHTSSFKRTLRLIPFVKSKFDIIHFEYSGLAIQYLNELDYLDSRKVISCRGTAELVKPLIDPVRASQLKKLMTKIDLAHCVSQNMRSTLINYDLPYDKAFINYPSIDVDYFKRGMAYADGNTTFTIVSTGRLTWIKGYNYALLGIKKVIDLGYQVRYEIVGEGSARDELTFIVRKLGLNDSVIFRGNLNRAQVKQALEVADVFLLPSLSEGVSNAALEAMAMELPVISTKVGGMSEVIESGTNGVLINEMHPEEVADNLIFLITNKELARQLGRNARETVEGEFSLNNQIKIFNDQYTELILSH